MILRTMKIFMSWSWVIMKLKSPKLVPQFKESFLPIKRLWIRWNNNKWFNINKVLPVKEKEIITCHWPLHMVHLLRTLSFYKSLMNVLAWSLVKKDKLSRQSVKDRALIRCRSLQEVPQVLRQETFLLRVTQMQ